MYIFQKEYSHIEKKESNLSVVLLLPSSPQKEMRRFAQIVEDSIMQLNNNRADSGWSLIVLSKETSGRSPMNNYSAIYTADVVIAECSDKKPNIFYMLGLAHAIGVPVCSCYKKKRGQHADIPFDVHGRQSLTYSLATTEFQLELKSQLMGWILKNENN